MAPLIIALTLSGCLGANKPPSIALIDDQLVFVGQQLTVPLEAFDPDGDALGWTVTGLDETAEVIAQSEQSALLLWSPRIENADPGANVFEVTITARDGRGGSVSDSFSVTVQPAYGVPTFDLPNGVVLNLAETDELNLYVAVKDDDSTRVTIDLLSGPEGAVISKEGNKSATLYWSPSTAQREEMVHPVVLRTADDTHAPVEHSLLVILVNSGAAGGCIGTNPTVVHDGIPDALLAGVEVPVALSVTDLESAVSQVTIHWSDTLNGDFKAAALERLELGEDGWMGQLEPGAVPFGGKIIYYYIEARDNDDPTGFACDGQSRWPKDGYGAFGVYAPGDLYSCVDDAGEPDDALSIASELAMGVHSGRRLCGGSPDYIRFTPPASGTLVVRVVYGESHGALLVRLLNANGTPIAVAEGQGGVLSVITESTGDPLVLEVGSADPEARITYTIELGAVSGPCESDSFEPNNTADDAVALTSGSWPNVGICTGDEDWFQFTLKANERLELAVSFDHQQGDLELELRDASGEQILASAAGESSIEALSFTSPSQTNVLARVTGYQGATNAYRLDASILSSDGTCQEDQAGVHLSPATAVTLFNGFYEGLMACAGVPDWYAVDVNGGETVHVTIGAPADNSQGLTVGLYEGASQSPIQTQSVAAGGAIDLSWTLAQPGTLFYEVSASTSSGYTLDQWVTQPAGPCQPDRFEPNDDMATAAPVNTEVLTSLRLCGDDDRDVFAVNIDAPKQLSILTNHEPDWGYSDIYLYQSDGVTLVDSSLDFDIGATLETLIQEDGLYYVEIVPFDVLMLPYDLAIVVE